MSLRLRLVLAIGLSLAVLWSGTALWMVRDLDRNLQHTLDERLAMSARMVAGLLAQSGSPGAPALSAQSALRVPGSRGMACQIRSLRGEVIATTRGADRAPMTVTAPGYRTTVADGEQWRTFTLRAEGFDITTADRMDERALLRQRIALAAGVPFLVAAFGGLLALWLGTSRALAPLSALQRTLAARDPDATHPVALTRLPRELRPLVQALNELLERMARALQRERNFTNNAAHELRTPLTVIDTHLQVARLTAGPGAQPALADAATGAKRMRSTLDQLLMLARVEGRLPFDEGAQITPHEVVERALATLPHQELVRVASRHAAPMPPVAVPPQLAVVALRNLIENALRYSPSTEPVEVQTSAASGVVQWRVVDRGPGLTAAQCASATARFWRGAPNVHGSGLGLALVEAIATRFGGSITLSPQTPHGLVAELILPIHGPDESAD